MREEYHSHHATAARSSDESPHATEQPSISNRPFRYDSLTEKATMSGQWYCFEYGIFENSEKALVLTSSNLETAVVGRVEVASQTDVTKGPSLTGTKLIVMASTNQ